jgi:hypothetical protein
MAEKPGFLRYVVAAFNARPVGMFVAPNWIGVGAAALLGLLEPGFWAIGAGLELGYLVLLANNGRFQRTVTAATLAAAPAGGAASADDWTARTGRALLQLGDPDRRRYQALAERCRSILDLQVKGSTAAALGLDSQHEGLARLAWLYLRLLVGRDTIQKVQNDQRSGPDLGTSLAALEARLAGTDLTEELRRSLDGQAEILRQRIAHRVEAARQLTFIESELTRIEQQVELIREQAALSTDPAMLSQRIDEITATLGGTSQWIRDQQQIFGAMDDLLAEPPPPPLTRTRERA